MRKDWRSRVGFSLFGLLAAAILATSFTGCLGASSGPIGTGSGGTRSTTVTGVGGTTVTGSAGSMASGSAGTRVGDPPLPTGTGGTAPGRGGTIGSMPITCSGGGSTGTGGRGSPATGGTASMTRGIIHPPNPGTLVTLANAPPSVSGGTLRVLSDGQTAVAADPDRDQIYVVDLAARAVTATVPLQAGDEPGRVIEDAAGRVHVALRRGGAIVTFNPRQQPVVMRRGVCASPRGLAYDALFDLVHVACADGELVSLPPGGGAAVRTLHLDRDLRDVVVTGFNLRVSRFRSAEVLTIDANGAVSQRTALPAFATPLARAGQQFSPGTAWQMVPMADGGVAVLHQRGVIEPIRPEPGGYGGANPCNSILHPAVTAVAADGTVKTGPALPGLVLAVDMAISPDGSKVAFVSMGNATNRQSSVPTMPPQLTRLFVTDVATATDASIGCKPDGTHGPCLAPGTSMIDGSGQITNGCPADPKVVGQPIAVAFAGDGGVVVQSREPAMLALADGTMINLSGVSRNDTGHLLFHANAGGFVACASCHTEGDDDGRVWSFGCDATGNASGPRRTQSLQTGLRGTEPFHWNGDELDFTQLMKDVFAGRMSGPSLPLDQIDAMVSWIDAQPRPRRAAVANPAAVQRGEALFNDTEKTGCTACHKGARFSNGLSVDVGTGRAFQVPSLLGVGTRGPWMHDGCAATLRDRFNPACGGDRHGITASLSSGQIDDLVAYLQSL
jgi:hypothetical protein